MGCCNVVVSLKELSYVKIKGRDSKTRSHTSKLVTVQTAAITRSS